MNSSALIWLPLAVLSLALGIITFWLPMWRDDMFIDGLVYATIAKNLSLGLGSLWDPFYTKTHFPHFYEHLPFALYLESHFFRWLGPDAPAERVYNVCIASLQIVLLACFWRTQSPRLLDMRSTVSVLSLTYLLLIWLAIPLNTLYVSNHLEASLTLFSSLAGLLLLIPAQNAWKGAFLSLLAIGAMDVAFLCNGPSAFFPLCIPLLRAFCLDDFRVLDAIFETCLLMIVCVLTLLIFYLLVPAAWVNTWHYLSQQLMPSIIGERQLIYTGFKHIHVLLLFLRAYWLVIIIAFSSVSLAAHLNGQTVLAALENAWSNRYGQLFFFVTLVASLPVGISHRQAFNYLMQSAPWMTISILCFTYQSVEQLLRYALDHIRWYCVLFFFSILSFAAAFCLLETFNPHAHRHEALLRDISELIRFMPADEIISASDTVFYTWYAGGYLARYSTLSLTPALSQRYYIALNTEILPNGYDGLTVMGRYLQLALKN